MKEMINDKRNIVYYVINENHDKLFRDSIIKETINDSIQFKKRNIVYSKLAGGIVHSKYDALILL